MLGMSPETLIDREVGNDLTANADIRINIKYNIETVRDIIASKDFGDANTLDNDLVITDRFTKSDIEYLRMLSVSGLILVIKQLEEADKYFNSGHNYIYGVDNVLDNIANFVDMKTDLSWAKEKNVTVAGNGSTYDKSTEGVIPEAMTYLFNYRKSLKNKMKEEKKLLQKKIEELHRLEAQMN